MAETSIMAASRVPLAGDAGLRTLGEENRFASCELVRLDMAVRNALPRRGPSDSG